MRTRPVDGAVATRPAAAAVVGFERPVLSRRDGSRRPTDVDRQRVRFQDPGQGAVAGEALHGFARDRHPGLELRGGRPQLALQAFQGRGDGDVRADPMALGQLALVHGLVDDLGQGVGPALLGRPPVVLAETLGEPVDSGLERGAGFPVEDPAEVVLAVHLADMEEALFVVLLDLAFESLGVDRIAKVIGDPVQVLDRVLAGKAEPLLFVQTLALLAQVLALVADHRRRLVADLAAREGFGDHGQGLQLLADTEPIFRSRDRHAAGARDPGSGRDVAANQVIAGSLRLAGLKRELTLELINDGTKLFEIYALVASPKLTHRRR